MIIISQALYIVLKVKGGFLKKLSMEIITMWAHNSTLRYILPGELKTYVQTKTRTWMFTAALFIEPKSGII